jgi:hypothetical protein
VYVGGFNKIYSSIFQRLAHYGIDVPEEKRYNKHFIVFDCESVLVKTEDGHPDATQWTTQHVPVSISMASTAVLHTEAKPACIVDRDPQELARRFMKKLQDWRRSIAILLGDKFEKEIEELNQKIAESESFEEGDEEEDDDTPDDDEEEGEKTLEEKWDKRWMQGL